MQVSFLQKAVVINEMTRNRILHITLFIVIIVSVLYNFFTLFSNARLKGEHIYQSHSTELFWIADAKLLKC